MERILARTLTHTEKHCEVARNRVAGGAYLSFDVANSFHFGALQSAPLEHFSAPFWHRIQNTQSLTHICSAGDPRSRETPPQNFRMNRRQILMLYAACTGCLIMQMSQLEMRSRLPTSSIYKLCKKREPEFTYPCHTTPLTYPHLSHLKHRALTVWLLCKHGFML